MTDGKTRQGVGKKGDKMGGLCLVFLKQSEASGGTDTQKEPEAERKREEEMALDSNSRQTLEHSKWP